MTDRTIPEGPGTPPEPEPARRSVLGPGERRTALLRYGLVAIISLLIGGGLVFLALRAGRTPAGVAEAQTGGPAATTERAAPAAADASMKGMPGMDTPAQPPGGPPTAASGPTVFISAARQQLIGVRTALVEHRALDTTIRTVGTLAYDETRVTQVNTKVAGWIERVNVDYVGKPVRRGEPLFSVYSPDLVATQNEYLLALKARDQFASSQVVETRASSESLLAATRQRLKLWDITDAQIADLEKTRQPRRSLTLYAPFTGIVLERNAFAGQYITPEMAAFKLADLSTIWVVGQVFEYELAQIAVGQDADIAFPYGEYGRTIKGRIGFIYPDIDPQTRRARIRVEFSNTGSTFKPGTYVTVSITTRGGHVLAVPKEAVIDTGVKQVAIVAHPNGYFEPREIKVGQPTDEFYPVLSGLAEGDQIVTSAQFMVDSEANLQSAMQAMSVSMPGMDMGGGKKTPPPPKAQPPTPSGDMPGMPGMKMPPPKAPAVPTDQMDDMPGMPGMKMPAAKKTPVPPKKKSGEPDQRPTTQAAGDAPYVGGAR
jgi:membrane fusion protein, copper/silver efflux system